MRNRAQLNTGMPAETPLITFPANTAQKWLLPNGLTIIVQEDRSAPVASVQVWCGTGSIDEDEHLGAGLSHILEHLLFKGTKTRGANQIAQAVQDVGGYINAYTSFDRTVYSIDVPKDGVPITLDVLSDAMMNSTLPPTEYAKEQEVIRREFAMGEDDADRMVGQLLFATAYTRHPYRLPVIGRMDVYNELTQEQVMQYYKKRYVPNNLTFVVVGDVSGIEVRDQLAQIFEKYPEKSLRPIYIPTEPQQLGRRELHQEFATSLTRLALAWHVPEVTHPDVPALDLLCTILGDGRSSRLYRRAREETALAFGVAAFCYTPGDPGILGVDATVEPDKRLPLQDLILEVIAEIQRDGVGEDELAKSKKTLLSHQLGQLTTMRGHASDIGTNWSLTQNLNFSREYLAAIQRVSLDDIRRVASRYLVDDNLTIVSLSPKGSLARNLTATTPITPREIQKITLPNGLRLLVREDARLPLVAMTAIFRSGLLAETPENNGISRLLSKTLLKGTAIRTAGEIAEQIEAVGGDIDSGARDNSFRITLDVTQPDLKLGIGVLADVILNATFPEDQIAREKEVQLASIREEDDRPTSVARNLLRTTMFGDHPFALRRRGSAASVARISRQDLLAFRDRYVVAKNGVISIFGNVTAAEIERLFTEALGQMKPGELAHQNVKPPRMIAAPIATEAVREISQAVIIVGFRGTDVFNPDRQALELIDEASSDIGSRFFVRIREQMGLAYYVGAVQMQGLVPGLFAFYVGTDPQKVDAVKQAMLEEVSALATNGLDAGELNRSKKKMIGQQQIANQSNETLGYLTALDELYGLGFDHYKTLESSIENISVEDIKRVAAKYFRDQSPVVVVVRPAAGATAVKE